MNSFGFGGTNAHAILADAPPPPPFPGGRGADLLVISAATRAALAPSRPPMPSGSPRRPPRPAASPPRPSIGGTARAERLAVPLVDGAAEALAAHGRGAEHRLAAVGSAVDAGPCPVAFVYSGNGSQWVGMGRAAHAASAAFRSRFDAIDRLYGDMFGWSPAEALGAEDLALRLPLTSVAQPLIFAIQAASTFALGERGLVPDMVLGHSVGEIAAAEAAGILSLADAVRVIHHRSHGQELARHSGGMAVVSATAPELAGILAAFPGLDVAAHNGPRAFTLAGPADEIGALVAAHAGAPAAARRLDLDYPFHSRLMAEVEGPVLRGLAGLAPRPGDRPMISTVTGTALAGAGFDAGYWWRNIREPVRFREAVEAAAAAGARLVLEVGPRPTLLRYIGDCFGETRHAAFGVHGRDPAPGDPFCRAAAQAAVRGAALAPARFGDDPGPGVTLPPTPWNRSRHRLERTAEATAASDPRPLHPLLGSRPAPEAPVWTSAVDAALLPAYADHRVGGQALLPGSGFVELALAAARDWMSAATPALRGLEILAPLVLSDASLRDLRVQIAPATRVVEIASRRRLAPGPWQVHARAKIVEGAVALSAPAERDAADGFACRSLAADTSAADTLAGDALYARAAAAGLAYGPRFRLAVSAHRCGPRRIAVALDAAPADPAYALDPMRLDACFHGLALVFAELGRGGTLRPYIPVRFDEVRLAEPGATAAAAEIRILRLSERDILADFDVRDADGRTVVEIRGARFHPMRLRRPDELARHTIVQRLVPATAPAARGLGASDLRDAVLASLGAAGDEALPPDALPPDVLPEAALLLEGWATARGFEIAAALASTDDGRAAVRPLALAEAGRIAEGQVGWLAHLLDALARSGLAERDGDAWRLADGAGLPRGGDVLSALAAEHPELSVELPLAAHLDARALAPPPAAALDGFELRGAFARQASAALARLLAGAAGRLPGAPSLRVLQLGSGPLSGALAPLAAGGRIALTVLEPDRRRCERARLALPPGVGCLAALDGRPEASFDLVVAADALGRTAQAALRAAADRLDRGGLLVAVEPAPSLFRDLVLGLGEGWFQPSADPLRPAGGTPDDDGWRRTLSGLGLAAEAPRAFALASGAARLLVAGPADATATASTEMPVADMPVSSTVAVFGDDGDAAVRRLAARLAARGIEATVADEGRPPASGFGTAIFMAGAFGRDRERGCEGVPMPGERLAERCLALKRCAAALAGSGAVLWVVCPGATRPESASAGPVQAGVWAFARTLANESLGLDVRRADVDPAFGSAVADRLCDLLLGGTDETEVVVDADRTMVLRVCGAAERPSEDPDARPAEAAALEQRTPGVLDGLRWAPARRARPGPEEVEIAVGATGLNFRDVLFALSMLPDDMLEDGFAGPGLGIECAGTVSRVGAGVTHVAPGEAVVAFARSGFATHVTVPGALVARAPAGLSAEAAATIPVAFMTAHHALVTQAGLRRRETVLVHGAAGGVGLAAIQVARRRGARVLATAGTPERRALAVAVGAARAFDSRSLAFVDGVRSAAPEGVDVVLNSLAGEAMEESLGLLKPFGRFVELGKRDYAADTHVGLRPFRRNLSYHGVDLDQLLLGRPSVGRQLLRDVMGLFRRGALTPLPYERFDAADVSDAFRLMQSSGHVGKVVVAPPAPGAVSAARGAAFRPDPGRAWVVSGGFGGFGAEAARWLVDRGVRHLLLLGRGGGDGDARARALVAELEARGAAVRAPPCDVADRAALAAALRSPGLPPVGGVIHAAMVLDDGLIADLDRARLDRVLTPKVAGADLLDALTRAMPVEHFVLFSSATTLIGNPGQGAYVAANAYLEAVARRRRRAGLPALAVAWGAIEDAGVLAGRADVRSRLAARTGMVALKARDALDLMAEALERQGPSPEEAVLGLVAADWSAARGALAVLRSPTYGALVGRGGEARAPSDALDLAALAAEPDREAARRAVVAAIAEEVARILRLPLADVARERPMAELGLDSLMGMELAAGLQARFRLTAPPADLAGTQSISGLAGLLLASADAPEAASGAAPGAAALARRHLGAEGDAVAARMSDGHTALPSALPVALPAALPAVTA